MIEAICTQSSCFADFVQMVWFILKKMRKRSITTSFITFVSRTYANLSPKVLRKLQKEISKWKYLEPQYTLNLWYLCIVLLAKRLQPAQKYLLREAHNTRPLDSSTIVVLGLSSAVAKFSTIRPNCGIFWIIAISISCIYDWKIYCQKNISTA